MRATKEQGKVPPRPDKGASAGPKQEPAGRDRPAEAEQAPGQKLTPEEQMAQFEKHLKENDWGHQPC